MMFGWDGGMGTGWWVLMILVWVVLIALVVWAIARLFPTRPDGEPGRPADRDTPQDILDRRLARGEIDVDEYARLREALTGAQEARR
ncbi:MAG: hypothetical protein AB1416_12910 [Actinomycetota bacterium]